MELVPQFEIANLKATDDTFNQEGQVNGHVGQDAGHEGIAHAFSCIQILHPLSVEAKHMVVYHHSGHFIHQLKSVHQRVLEWFRMRDVNNRNEREQKLRSDLENKVRAENRGGCKRDSSKQEDQGEKNAASLVASKIVKRASILVLKVFVLPRLKFKAVKQPQRKWCQNDNHKCDGH